MKRIGSILSVIFVMCSLSVIAQDPQNMKVEDQVLNCETMKTSFKGIEDAKEVLDKTVFAFTQELKTTRRSGVKEVHYYTCDHESGYLLITIDDMEFVYKNYPRFQWKLLIETNDLDEFYAKNIRGKYTIAASSR